MKIFGRVKDYIGKVAATVGTLFGDGYQDTTLAADRNVGTKRIEIPVVAARYNHFGGIDALLKTKFSLSKDSDKISHSLDEVVLHAEKYVGSIGASTLEYFTEGLSDKAGLLREAYKTREGLGVVANDLAKKFDNTVLALEKVALDYDMRVIKNGLTGDIDEITRSLENISRSAKRYVELFDENKISSFVSRLKDDASLILKAYEGSVETVRPLVDMYQSAALSLTSARCEQKEEEKEQVGYLDLDLSLADQSNVLGRLFTK